MRRGNILNLNDDSTMRIIFVITNGVTYLNKIFRESCYSGKERVKLTYSSRKEVWYRRNLADIFHEEVVNYNYRYLV